MKTLKRMMSGALAVLLLVCLMAVPASAQNDSTTYTITINNAESGHTYEAYQIFDGDLDGETLSNIIWGPGVNGEAATAGLKKTAAVAATALANEEDAKAFAVAVAPYLSGTKTTAAYDSNNKKYTISGLDAGYYLVKDMDNSQNSTGGHYTRYIIAVVNNVSVVNKSGVPTIAKAAKGADDADFAEAISACIGETVTYRITVSMHGYVNDFDAFYFRIEDTLPTGVTYKELTSVQYVNGSNIKTVDAAYYDVSSAGQVVTFTVADALEAIRKTSEAKVFASDTLVFTYTATVSGEVDIGKPGNLNTAILYYANNPNEKTYNPESDPLVAPVNLGTASANAYVYSYQLNLLKVDATESAKKLKDAKFVLSRIVDGTTREYAVIENGKLVKFTTNENDKTVLSTDENGVFSVAGLASNTYRLQETVAPAGYNLPAEEITVTITGALNKQTGMIESLSAESVGAVSAQANVETGVVNITVVNHGGTILPSTGGMGTTLFYVAGIVLVAGAATVLFAKKRSERN